MPRLNPRLKPDPITPITWSEQALQDVQRLYRFLVPISMDAAKRAIEVIRQGVKVLRLQPLIGRPLADMDEGYREWLIDFGSSGYVILYRYDGLHVLILAVRHQREAGYS
jgi:plasmid stabilization system protein ParE